MCQWRVRDPNANAIGCAGTTGVQILMLMFAHYFNVNVSALMYALGLESRSARVLHAAATGSAHQCWAVTMNCGGSNYEK